MARSIDSNITTQTSSATVNPFYAVKMEFSTGNVNLWTGVGDLTIGSDTYTGGGSLLGIDAFEETSEIKAAGMKISLSGMPSDLLSLSLSESYQGRNVTVLFGVLTDLQVVSGTPYTMFVGKMDKMSINDTGSDVTFTLACESRLIVLERPNPIRYTDEEQNRLFDGDKGLEYVADIQDKPLVWGGD